METDRVTQNKSDQPGTGGQQDREKLESHCRGKNGGERGRTTNVYFTSTKLRTTNVMEVQDQKKGVLNVFIALPGALRTTRNSVTVHRSVLTRVVTNLQHLFINTNHHGDLLISKTSC
jgi:hypothetical protein